MMAEWYSDEALRKQALADELAARGERVPLDVMLGILAPRVEPTEAELCANCGCDARSEVGGEAHGGKRWCGICIGRGRHSQYVVDLSATVAAVHEWCETQTPCVIGKGCVRCAVRAELVEEVRSLLPPVPEVAGEVDMGTRVTRGDREYPGGGSSGNRGDDNHWRNRGGTDSGN